MPPDPSMNDAKRPATRQSLGDLPGWFANWAYWNANLYRLPGAPQARAELKYRKKHKKFGVDYPIIVYQMGKVGSSSVYETLNGLDLDVPVYHAHSLNRFEVYAEGVRRTRVNPQVDLAALEEGRALRHIVDSGRWKQWLLINIVRAPVPRAISDFFENVASYVPDFENRLDKNELNAADLTDVFLHQYRDTSLIHWYDDQMRDVFEIDVFETPFPYAQGYAFYKARKARLVILRLEDLNRCFAPALNAWLGIPNVTLHNKNIGGAKNTGSLYREFLDQLRLPAAYIDEIHSSRYARQFYAPHELEASVARWVETPTRTAV